MSEGATRRVPRGLQSAAARARAALLGACALLLLGCSDDSSGWARLPGAYTRQGAPLDAERVLNVYNWSDYIDPAVVSDFEKEFGIKVHYDVFDSNEVLETKLLTGRTNYDLVVPSGPFFERQIKAGIYQKLHKELLPNLQYLDPQVREATAQYDPGNQYGVDYMWITSGPGYDAAKIRARLPDAPVASWRLLYDPAVVSHFAGCGVSMLDAPSEVVATVLLYLGRNPNSQAVEDLQAAERTLRAMRPYVRYVHSSRYIDDLANGDICLALGWSGDVKQASDRAHEAGKALELAYAIPAQGAISNYDMLAIPADAPHPRNAHLFINYLLRPAVAARNSNLIKYANSVVASVPLLLPSVRDDPGIYPPPEVRARLVPERAKSIQFTRLLTRMWTRFKTGR
jgi:putrescine transport system substrate-binding protein